MQPSPIHHSLKTNGKRRVIVIGDVHGCLDELKALLLGLSPPYEQEKDVLIFVGDLVGKGPDSCGVVTFVREMGALSTMGNWEIKAMKNYDALSRDGRTKVKKKWEFVKDLSVEDVMLLKGLPYTITLSDLGYIVVHAGLVPGRSLQEQTLDDMSTMRSLTRKPDGTFLATSAGSDGDNMPWAEHWIGPPHVLFGHDARRGLQQCKFATGLDTECNKGGSLTACILPSTNLYCVKKGETTIRKLEPVKTRSTSGAEHVNSVDVVDDHVTKCTVQ